MQKTIAVRLITTLILIFVIIVAGWNTFGSGQAAFKRDQGHVTDNRTGHIAIYHPDGMLSQAHVSPDAEPGQQQSPLPAEIIRFLLTQSKLTLAHTLKQPVRLAWSASGGKLYVSDYASNSVFIYDSDLTVIGELKGLAGPLGVIADDEGNILVGNRDRNNVEVYDPFGNLLRSMGGGAIAMPSDLALDRAGNIYILDSAADTVLVYDQNGNTLPAIGGSDRIGFGVSIAINYRDDGSGTETGELYIADQQACAIHIFALDGTYRKSVGECGSIFTDDWGGKFSGLMAVDIDQNGNINGLDNNLNVVQVFDPENGSFVGSYNAYPAANEYLLNLQTDFGIHPADHRVVMANAATGKIELISVVPKQ